MDAARLSSPQAAARLGVRLETLYAYVSRGLLTRERGEGGSTFDALEIERFALTRTRGRATASGDAREEGRPMLVIETDIAHVDDDGLHYRGVPVADLVGRRFEDVVHWLVTGEELGEVTGVRPVTVAPDPRGIGPLAGDPLDRMKVAVALADPVRFDLDPAALSLAVRGLIGTAVGGLGGSAGAVGAGDPGTHSDREPGIVPALWRALTPAPPRHRALEAALIALIDHDLAVSTLAVRAAASARAGLPSALLAGLGAFDAPLHGRASEAAYRLLAALRDGADPARALATASVFEGRGVPGFARLFHGRADERFALLHDAVAAEPGTAGTVALVDGLVDVVDERLGLPPTVDLGLAMLTMAFDMGEHAGPVVFATGRLAGWALHALDETTRAPLRLRPVGRYVGP